MSEIEKYYNGEIHVDFDKETIKITQPMFEPGELESFDNYIHSIVEDYSKMKLHEKEQILTQRIIMKQEEEIERLNKGIEYIEDRFTIENGEYYLTHTFDKDNVKELYDILRGDKE